MASTVPYAHLTSQRYTVPHIPELYDPNFLDVLLPPSQVSIKKPDEQGPTNPLMEALKDSANRTMTANGAPALESTLSATLDAFSGLTAWADAQELDILLTKSWYEDPVLTLRLIWQLRSIHDGKAEKEGFYRAFGWLYKNHPRTAISNLHMLVDPVCRNRKKPQYPFAHGYWKDLLNILALATTDELDAMNATFLHAPRMPYTYPARANKGKDKDKTAHARHNASTKARAKTSRAQRGEERHDTLLRLLAVPKYRALYIAVTRLFTDQLINDLNVMHDISQLSPTQDRIPLLKKISLAGKWAPSPGASHDRVTNIASAVALLLHHNRASIPQPFPSSVPPHPDAMTPDAHTTLRSYLGRWVLRPLRALLLLPEPLMAANRWSEIRYTRVSSLAMKLHTEAFFTHDPERFQEYLLDVESGKQTISGATLLPHEIVGKVMECDVDIRSERGVGRYPRVQELKRERAETQVRVLEAQWNSLVERVREAGKLEGSLAICDVSGSMGSLYTYRNARTLKTQPRHPSPILPATLQDMVSTDWGMNTDFAAVFLKLLLPLAVQHRVRKEDMVKQLFVFSDMGFDDARGSTGPVTQTSGKALAKALKEEGEEAEDPAARAWKTNHDEIVDAYARAGYEVPRIVYWDLSDGDSAYGTKEATAEREGVAMMNGFSPGMLKVFMGEEDERQEGADGEGQDGAGEKDGEGEDGDWEKVGEKTKKELEDEKFTPLNVMKRAVMWRSFDGLVVID
ncbi:hypothetical protein BDP27DRAFT_1391451 [Rhodocollybia butyracea]|uniref:Uncharacterized protein n=1 Tax=Rhodocollybia butyracea TaxID=206335 RepID=A0A9P5Q181_9AGAR|nr:hypothetical protein BDP27DRAFT_1391451 [Rhodocollybia butyracea]